MNGEEQRLKNQLYLIKSTKSHQNFYFMEALIFNAPLMKKESVDNVKNVYYFYSKSDTGPRSTCLTFLFVI